MKLDEAGRELRGHKYGINGEGITTFVESEKDIYLGSLFGLSCGVFGADTGPLNARGLMRLDTDKDRFDTHDFSLAEIHLNDKIMNVSWVLDKVGLKIESRWSFCEKTGVWSRRDILRNIGQDDVLIFGCMARFVFSPGHYEVFGQSSRWCYENQGYWQTLNHGSLVFGCEGGRTAQGSTPYLCIRNIGDKAGVIFHIIPKGNWVIKLHARTAPGDSLPFAVLELGLADENLHLCLKSGQQAELPEILIQEQFQGELQPAASRLHRYLLNRLGKPSDHMVPVVYNSWFDAFDCLNMERLENQLAAVKNIGCEVFVVDAGWYGAGSGDWFAQAGDWSEKQNGAFYGRMKEFADKVRASGMGFGLWMEPERIGAQTPVYRKHPEWFVAAGNEYFYPDLINDEVYIYIRSEISRLIETYGLVWIKLDFNFDLGIDPYGSEFLKYYEAWYRLLDEIGKEHTDVFVEGCSSGGMRLDIKSQMHCDAHFISDNVNPLDVLKIYQGAILRLLPGRLAKWVVLRSAGNSIPKYGTLLADAPITLITPGGATWDTSVTTRVDFAVLVAMTGVLGFSGNIAGLPEIIQSRLRQHVDFYKKHKRLLYDSVGYLLMPVPDKDDNRRWTALQLQYCQGTESILFIYRLDDPRKVNTIKPCALNDKRHYRVEFWDGRKDIGQISGEKLMEEGIAVIIPEKYEAVAIVLTPIK